MNGRLGRLGRLGDRRAALCARSARLRRELAAGGGALALRFGVADRLVSAARSGTAQALLIGAAAFVVFGRPRLVLGLAMRALALWPVVASLLPRLRRMLDAHAR